MGGFDDFWDNIASAHRVDGGAEPDRPVLTPDPLESEPESDEEDRTDGIFSPQFVESTGVHVYMKMCRELGVVPVQQFISMLDHEVVSLKHRGVGSVGGKAIFECLRFNKHIQALDMEDNQLGLNVDDIEMYGKIWCVKSKMVILAVDNAIKFTTKVLGFFFFRGGFVQ